MANELSRTSSINFTKGGVNEAASFTETITVAGTRMIHQVQSIGFAAREAIQIAELSGVGCFVIKNLDATNFVEIFPDAAVTAGTIKLKAGEVAMGRFGSAAQVPGMKADTAAVLCDIRIWED